ncbi:PREDICTED: lipoma HMGIC fusion partner-like 3 protein [Nicrophorus vespilloides]|uniref:Lipoma HMGIC fusion partner-like 3 protein n=1 Tax=Nicrophorus vespilloides TaxID=110193 RepID=A0ABM1MQF3_NICVS|nr:PREDICTED: lipoma HMGIC fusion partner-like 3 protein [Nicrophorus vespilloides]
MGSKIEYVDSTQIYATSYVRNSKAIGVLWAIFTICYAIIGVVSFVTPEWIGNVDGERPGKFGLWAECYAEENGESCKGRLDEFYLSTRYAFQGATVAVGAAVCTALLSICAMLLFIFCHSTTVYHICAWLQLISAICMITGCSVFPLAWSEDNVVRICGPSDQYVLGNCGIRWAYLLAAIGCLDAVILSILAFILATRHIRLQPDPQYAPASLFKGEMNGAFVNDAGSVAGSRKSLNLHPVMMMHPGQDDTYSQFSQRTVPRSTHSGHYSHPHSIHQHY